MQNVENYFTLLGHTTNYHSKLCNSSALKTLSRLQSISLLVSCNWIDCDFGFVLLRSCWWGPTKLDQFLRRPKTRLHLSRLQVASCKIHQYKIEQRILFRSPTHLVRDFLSACRLSGNIGVGRKGFWMRKWEACLWELPSCWNEDKWVGIFSSSLQMLWLSSCVCTFLAFAC